MSTYSFDREVARLARERMERRQMAHAIERFQDRVGRLEGVLLECREYFEDRADAELVGDPASWEGNEEMTLLGRIEEVLG